MFNIISLLVYHISVYLCADLIVDFGALYTKAVVKIGYRSEPVRFHGQHKFGLIESVIDVRKFPFTFGELTTFRTPILLPYLLQSNRDLDTINHIVALNKALVHSYDLDNDDLVFYTSASKNSIITSSEAFIIFTNHIVSCAQQTLIELGTRQYIRKVVIITHSQSGLKYYSVLRRVIESLNYQIVFFNEEDLYPVALAPIPQIIYGATKSIICNPNQKCEVHSSLGLLKYQMTMLYDVLAIIGNTGKDLSKFGSAYRDIEHMFQLNEQFKLDGHSFHTKFNIFYDLITKMKEDFSRYIERSRNIETHGPYNYSKLIKKLNKRLNSINTIARSHNILSLMLDNVHWNPSKYNHLVDVYIKSGSVVEKRTLPPFFRLTLSNIPTYIIFKDFRDVHFRMVIFEAKDCPPKEDLKKIKINYSFDPRIEFSLKINAQYVKEFPIMSKEVHKFRTFKVIPLSQTSFNSIISTALSYQIVSDVVSKIWELVYQYETMLAKEDPKLFENSENILQTVKAKESFHVEDGVLDSIVSHIELIKKAEAEFKKLPIYSNYQESQFKFPPNMLTNFQQSVALISQLKSKYLTTET